MSTLQTYNLKHPDASGNQITFTSGGDVNFDNGAVYIDSTNNRLGVGTSSPGYRLDVTSQLGCTYSGAIRHLVNIDSDGGKSYWYNGTPTNTAYIAGDTGNAYFAGSVGIGTTSPAENLQVQSASNTTIRIDNEDDSTAQLYFHNTGSTDMDISVSSANMTFSHGASERVRIDSSGRLLVGTSSAVTTVGGSSGGSTVTPEVQIVTSGSDSGLFVNRTEAFAANVYLGSGSNGNAVANDSVLGILHFQGYSAAASTFRSAARILCEVDGEPDTAGDTTDMPGRLVFSTTANGASSPTERMRINKTGQVSITNASTNSSFIVSSVGGTSESFAGTDLFLYSNAAAASTWKFFQGNSDQNGSPDIEFILRGDGNAYADGSWNGGGADYAEYFEWNDGNPNKEDRRGISVVLDGEKIRPAVDGEDPIGVISGNPSVVGDAAWNKWSGKYLRDDYGTYIQEDYEVLQWTDEQGNEHAVDADSLEAVDAPKDANVVIQQRRKLNPAYNPDLEYTSREERPEWDCVGLMGKLRIRKGQPTGNRWIKMRDISDSVEEWLVH